MKILTVLDGECCAPETGIKLYNIYVVYAKFTTVDYCSNSLDTNTILVIT